MRSAAILSLLALALVAAGGCSKKKRGQDAPERAPAENPNPALPVVPDPSVPAAQPGAAEGGEPADSPTVSRENFARVKRGMTQEEVERVLGPGQRVPRSEIHRAIRSNQRPGRTDSTVLKWRKGPETILLELIPRSGLAAGWYVTEKPDGTVSYDFLAP
jgi:hypothetical protein